MLIARACHSIGMTNVPPQLNFIWMPPTTNELLRDPSFSTYRFDKVSGYAPTAYRRHIESNLRTNWLLAKLVTGSRFAALVNANHYWMRVTPMRALEAALFMIGYDLAGNCRYP
jgi:hypothetical protein